ncbi:MAG: hypothetical protein KF851_00625 [Pirellulaceae bacterium]|nr:hypothetical protein [Pirellulaceae bacterium]
MLYRIVLGAAFGLFILQSAAIAQPPGGRGGFGGGGQAGGNRMMVAGGGMGSAFLLMNDRVREELDLVDSQVRELEELQQSMGEKMQELFRDMRGGGAGGDWREAMEGLRPKMEQITKDLEQDIDEILTPDQRRRFKQLYNQTRIRGFGGSVGQGLLDNDEIKKELNITSSQEDKLKEEAAKAQEFVREETAKIQKKAMERILGVLDADQRKKYQEMVGDEFDFGQNQFNFGGNRGGNNRGGDNRGGDRGGQGRGRSDF